MKNTRITLAKFKVAKFASEETLCFEAEVYFDGKLLGRAFNDGHGGQTSVHAVRGGSHNEHYQAAEAYAKSLGPVTVKSSLADREDFTYEMTLDHVVDDLANQAMLRRDVEASLRRSLKKKCVYIKDGELWNSKPKNAAVIGEAFFALVQKMNPTAVILNRMPMAQAVEAYIAIVEAKEAGETV